jgi:acetyl esterase/lipase
MPAASTARSSRNLTVETVALAKEDALANAGLRDCFRRFWADATGEPRAIYDRFIGATPLAPEVRFDPMNEDGVQGWWCLPEDRLPDRILLYLHGGAYIQGSPEAYRNFASQIAARAQAATLVARYPLAPEHPMPAAPRAALTAYRWLAMRGHRQIALCGDSGGGGLALVTLAMIAADRTLPRPVAGVVFSPWTDLALTGASIVDPAVIDPLISRELLQDGADAYLAGADPYDALASPLHGSMARLPPLLIQVGTDELLRDDSIRYAQAAARAGTPVKLEIWEGLHHVFQLNGGHLASACRALDHAALFLHNAWADREGGRG